MIPAPFRIRAALRVIAFVLATLSPARAAELLVFEGTAPQPAPSQARVRSLPNAEIWIFQDAAERDATLSQVGAGVAISTEGPTALQRRKHGHDSEPGSGVNTIWSDAKWRILEATTGSSGLDLLDSCVEPLVYLPPAITPSPLAIGLRASSPADEADLVGSVDPVRYAQIIRELSGDVDFSLAGSTEHIRTRWTLDPAATDGINLARAYLTDRLTAAG